MLSADAPQAIGWTCQYLRAVNVTPGGQVNLVNYGDGPYGAGVYPVSGIYVPGYLVKRV